MKTTKLHISLSKQELQIVESIINDTDSHPLILTRAKILKLSNIKEPKPIQIIDIADQVGTSRQTVIKTLKTYFDEGFQAVLTIKLRGGYEKCKLNDTDFLNQIQGIIAEPPVDGHKRWSLRLICAECIKRGYATNVTPTTVMNILKKNNIQI